MEEEKVGKKLNRDTCSVPKERSEFWCGVLKGVIIGLAIFIAIILIFSAGMLVGEMKARFSYRWAENYHKMFAGPEMGFLGNFRPPFPGDFIESHGTFGEIIKIDDNTLVVKGKDNIEKSILVNEKTAIKFGFKDIKISDLKVGYIIVVIGSPNEQGQIEAKLIRVFSPQISIKQPKFYE